MGELFVGSSKLLLIAAILSGGWLVAGCGSTEQKLPTQEKIKQQVEQDAARRAEEDRLEKETAR